MSVLVIAAHPDDEVLGCGATIARRARAGERVDVLILGEGLSSRLARREDVPRSELAQLEERARAAARVLGACEPRFLRLPDNRFDSLPLLEITQRIEGVLRELAPRTVYTHQAGDLNLDHVLTHRAVLTALRPSGAGSVRELWTFEVASSTEWSFAQFAPSFRPSGFVDVSASLEHKLAAMECYESEARAFPHPRSARALRAQAELRGAQAGFRAAEAFELVYRLDG